MNLKSHAHASQSASSLEQTQGALKLLKNTDKF